ncbi:MAG: cobalamin-binding protein [Candidatus Muproteobacteria bacterium RIFCSPHIGHO2_01_FULL_65_16]|uniref:Cobalamin-binding protein n=1 Tax=Candidatus Muproteobacteria bacterium RIFCSPHIGHO2_01_FULL_65_16 TaxID=1817764 RepID=A0A1F6TQ09_9PROT|nr:MAG: cobalamin-binding protein [Candidatus Muproteobacteria bacterium RIFCSPHIGHO2_01_FULL_65_16]
MKTHGLLAGVLLGLLGAAPAPAPTRVPDDAGATVVLAAPARRVVSLAPHVTELLYAAGAGGYVVGAVDYSDYPEAAKRIPRVGSYTGLDLEAIVALRPDLIIAWQSGNPPSQVERLRALGLAVYVSEPRHIEDVATNIERLGRLAGTADAALRAARAFRQRHEALRRRYAARPAVTVFYQIWDRPLMTVNGKQLISDVIHLCGGRNVFADLPILAPTVDVEAVLAADPEAIVASGAGASRPEWFDAWRRWPQLRAVRRDNLFVVPPDVLQRHGPRILDGAEHLCADLEAARGRR